MKTTVGQDISIETIKCEPGIGKIIRTPDSRDLIEGVQVRTYDLWPDDRGYFLEVVRLKQGLAADFDPETTQVSAALSYPGTIKAFHFHHHQTDLWVPSQGMFQVALVDLRPDSCTYGLKNTLYTGALKPWQIFIPPGVGHGYKVIGEHPGMLIYVTNRLYNPQDEGRIAHNLASIAYDWELQHK
ncbi:MAG: dTDP-4-dehydrorhamnose 3,5-epimerase family protein [Acidobacteriota bacterium]